MVSAAKVLTVRAEDIEERDEEMCLVIRSEKLQAEPTDVYLAKEANRHPLTQKTCESLESLCTQ